MAKSQDRRLARSAERKIVKVKGPQTTRGKRCFVPVMLPTSKFPVPCGDRAVKAGRCTEHYADWKHAKEARRGMSTDVVAHVSPLKNHGTGKSASARQNKRDRARRLAGNAGRKGREAA